MKTEPLFDKVGRPGCEMFEIIVHPCPTSSIMVVNYPGYNGHIDGYNMKYRKMAEYWSKQGLGTFIQMPNITRPVEIYRHSLIEDLRAVCARALELAPDICATSNPDIYLAGFSAGGGAVAGAAAGVRAKKIRLLAPSGYAAQDIVTKSFATFTGEVFIAIGDKDDVVGPVAGQIYYNMATAASRRELVVITNCDHQFRGTVNGQIMSNAYLWAFAGNTTFPSPEGGLILY